MANRARVRDRIAKAMAEIREMEMSVRCEYCLSDPGIQCHTASDHPTYTHRLRTYAALRMRAERRNNE